MDIIWNQNRIMNLLQSFYVLVKARIGFWNLSGEEILGSYAENSGFCSMIKTSPKGFRACKQCDVKAYGEAAGRQGPYIYQCHAGLTEMIAPISTTEGDRIAYLMIGQVRQSSRLNSREWEEISKKLIPLRLNMDELKSAWEKVPVMKVEQIRACADILQSLAAYVWLDSYIRLQNEPLSSRVKNYINENLDKKLSLTGIAGEFRVGKTTLCTEIKRDCHVTVNELIRAARIERAKFLLQSEELLVSDIAEKVGIFDYNYFARIFKEETGIPPSVFRKLCEKEYLLRRPAAPSL